MVICKATLEDSKDVWIWRNDPLTRRMFRSSRVVKWSTHNQWFKLSLQNRNRILLIGYDGLKEKVGIVRLDLINKHVAEVSINLNPNKRGLKLSKPLLSSAIQYARKSGITEFYAEIKNNNTTSLHIFKETGFKYIQVKDEMSLLKMTSHQL